MFSSSACLHVWHRVAEKPKEDARSWSAKQPIRSVRQGQVKRSSQSEASLTGQVDRTDQSVAFTKKRQGALLVQSDSSGRWTRRTPRHTRQKHRLSQSKGFGASFGWTSRRNRWLSQSHQSVGLSSDRLSSDGSSLKTESSAKPITSVDRIIFGRLSSDGYLTVILRSHSSENLQDRTYFSYRPIRSLGRLFNR